MSRRFLLMFMLVFTLIIGVACSGADDGDQGETNSADPVSSEENEEGTDDEVVDVDSNEESDEDTDLNSERASTTDEESEEQQSQQDENQVQGELPEPIELNEQIQHPKGLIFVLEKITFKEDHILVDFNAENHTGYSQYLASAGEATGEDLGGITLEDDTGFVYRYIAEDNDRIKLDDREKVTGTVSFTGTIQDDAETITLIFNPDHELEFAFENLELVR